MKKSTGLIFLTLMAISTASFADHELESMSQAEVQKAFVNHSGTSIPTVRLNSQAITNTFKFYMDSQGQIFGKFLNKPQGQPQADQGTYTISSDGQVHISWQHWDGAKPICFYFYDTTNDYLAVGCDNSFHTAFVKASMQAGNQLK